MKARRYFHCIGCGGIAGVLLEDSEEGSAGSVFHMKPPADANRKLVQCKLFVSTSAEDYARLHEAQPDLSEHEDAEWTPASEPASTRYLAEWLASQFQRPEQLRAYFDLSREERLACFPPARELADLDYDGWLELARLALQEMDQRTRKGVSN